MDGLTGVFNRRYLEERLSEEINRCRRHGGYLGLMMIDVDDFKQINDTFGHAVGDEVLKEVAGLLQKSCRNIDIVGRYGGDEFLVILIETSEPEALRIAERIQQKAREVTIPPHKPLLGLSIGVASQNSDYGGILKKADDRMYAQKRLNPLHS
jgi:diguanylate cyclase (GGDEF)-like protein